MLWAFDILPVIGENGKDIIPPSTDFTGGIINKPTNLRFRLVPRTRSVEELIILEAERAETEAAQWE